MRVNTLLVAAFAAVLSPAALVQATECVCDDSWDTAPCHSWITDPSRDCGVYYASNGQCEELGEGCVTQGGDGTAAPAVVEIAFVVSFTEEVGLIDEIRACNALVTEIAALAMIDEDYFECGMTLSDGSTRHLLSFVYNTEIVITIPATDLATSEGDMMVEGLQATVADTGTLTDVLNTSLETALPNNVGAVTSKIDVVVELPYSTTETDSSTQSPTAFTYTNCRDCSIQRRGNLRKLSFGRVPCCITQI